MNDFIDRRLTAWNRAWIILFGLWLLALGQRVPAPVGTAMMIAALVMIVPAAGFVELAMALWYRRRNSGPRNPKAMTPSRTEPETSIR